MPINLSKLKPVNLSKLSSRDLEMLFDGSGSMRMADVIVNHVSSRSPQFEEYLRCGADSRYAGMPSAGGGIGHS